MQLICLSRWEASLVRRCRAQVGEDEAVVKKLRRFTQTSRCVLSFRATWLRLLEMMSDWKPGDRND
jgi:hypothetical protein